ncbi:MAG: FeoB-associated Cys-rich membrane protein [Lachnospiraceae bacterium]
MLGNIIIIAILVLAIAGVITYWVRRRKRGEVGCSCGCSGCSSTGCNDEAVPK